MARAKALAEVDPFEAARIIYETLKPLDADTRHRVMVSALSLLGMDAATLGPNTPDPSAAGATPAQPHSSPSRPVSPVELVQQKDPSTNAQRLAVFAYYRERNEGKGRFSRADLRDYFAKSRLAPPQNYDRDFMTAVELGYIYEDGSESYLTSKGLEAVEQGFGGKSTPRRAKGTSKKRGAKRRPEKKSRRSL